MAAGALLYKSGAPDLAHDDSDRNKMSGPTCPYAPIAIGYRNGTFCSNSH